MCWLGKQWPIAATGPCLVVGGSLERTGGRASDLAGGRGGGGGALDRQRGSYMGEKAPPNTGIQNYE